MFSLPCSSSFPPTSDFSQGTPGVRGNVECPSFPLLVKEWSKVRVGAMIFASSICFIFLVLVFLFSSLVSFFFVCLFSPLFSFLYIFSFLHVFLYVLSLYFLFCFSFYHDILCFQFVLAKGVEGHKGLVMWPWSHKWGQREGVEAYNIFSLPLVPNPFPQTLIMVYYFSFLHLVYLLIL